MGILEQMQALNNELIKRIDLQADRLTTQVQRVDNLSRDNENLRRRIAALENDKLNELITSDKVVDGIMRELEQESEHEVANETA